MNGVVGLVAFCVLCACFIAACFAVMFWARDVKCELELLDWRSSRARRRIEEVDELAWRALSVVRGLEKRVKELEAEVADHRAFLNFIEDYTIEADAAAPQALPSGCDCCNPELD
nr:MAG TPA: zipper dimerization domain transcription factor-like protein [Caudoviricetes sp.]